MCVYPLRRHAYVRVCVMFQLCIEIDVAAAVCCLPIDVFQPYYSNSTGSVSHTQLQSTPGIF